MQKFNMQAKTNFGRYMEQDTICNDKIAIILPFLKQFSKEHDAGTAFYEDITSLSGLSLYGPKWFYDTDEGKEVYELYRQNKVSIYTIKWAGASFVMEYGMPEKYANVRLGNYRGIIKNAFMVWGNQKFPVSLDIAKAVKDLCAAQEYRSVIYCAHKEEIERMLKQQVIQYQK
jgi:hypothetical protein